MQRISTRTHGILDYTTAAMFCVVPNVMGATTIGKRVMYGIAAGTIAYSALTKYELGVAKVLPMKAHLALDGTVGALLCGAAFMHKGTSSRATMIGMGLLQIAAALATTTESPIEHREAAQKKAPLPRLNSLYQRLVTR